MNRRKFLSWLGIGTAAAATGSILSQNETIDIRRKESDADYYWRKRSEIAPERRGDQFGGWVSYKFRYTVSLPPDRRLFSRIVTA